MENQKEKFSLKEGSVYLNCAYMSPLLKSAENKGIEGMFKKRNPFQISQTDFFIDRKLIQEEFSNLIGVLPHHIALMPSVSYGFASVLNNIQANKRKKVIVVENEFPSVYFAAKKWCEKNDAHLVCISSTDTISNRNEKWNQDIIEQIDENSAFVILSAVHWMDGTNFDLNNIGNKCKTVGAKFLVDGTQAVGVQSFDLKKIPIDFLVCATYKWLFSPYSSALAYFSKDFFNGTPIEESWMNRSNAEDFTKLSNYSDTYLDGANRYHAGQTNDFIKLPMLKESLRQINEWKVENIENYCEKLLQPLIIFLKEIGLDINIDHYQAKHLLGFKVDSYFNATNLDESFQKNQIYLSKRGDSLRVSPNVYNTSEDIDLLIKVLSNHLKK